VLHLVTRFLRGGSEQRVRDLVAALPDVDHEVIVGAESDVDGARTQLGVPVSVEPHLVRSLRLDHDVRAVVAVRARLRRDPVALVVTHQSKAGVVGRVAARLGGGIPVVHSLSMASFGPGYGRVESATFQIVERVLAPFTARYVVVGADLARRFEVAGIDGRKLTVVRSGATLPTTRPAQRSVAGVPDHRRVILCVGALEHRKHPLDLVPILVAVRTRIPDAMLVVAGEGPLAGALADAVRAAGLESDVVLAGYVKPVEPLMWRADVVVLLSNAEGLPQVLIQAAAAGVPFVSYDVDGAHELLQLGARGTVVAIDDRAGAARAIATLLEEDDAGVTVDASSWDRAVIHSSYRRVVDDVLSEVRRVG